MASRCCRGCAAWRCAATTRSWSAAALMDASAYMTSRETSWAAYCRHCRWGYVLAAVQFSAVSVDQFERGWLPVSRGWRIEECASFHVSACLAARASACLPACPLQFQHPAQSGPASFRALDVRRGGSELLLGTHCCDLWELNPAAATGGINASAAAASTARPGSAAAAASVLPEPLIQGHTGDVWGVAYHPLKPHRFVTACESNSIFVWHGRRRQLMVSGANRLVILGQVMWASPLGKPATFALQALHSPVASMYPMYLITAHVT